MEIRPATADPDTRMILFDGGKFFFGAGNVDRWPLPTSVNWLSLGLALRRPDRREFWGATAS